MKRLVVCLVLLFTVAFMAACSNIASSSEANLKDTSEKKESNASNDVQDENDKKNDKPANKDDKKDVVKDKAEDGEKDPENIVEDKVEETDTESELVVAPLSVTLYFPDKEALYLHPEIRTVEIKEDEMIEEVILRELFAGPLNDELSPSLEGEELINSIVVDDNGECTVDFKSDFLLLNTGGSTREGFVLGSIVNSLCTLDYINSVRFSVEGMSNIEFGHTILDYAMEPMPDLVKE